MTFSNERRSMTFREVVDRAFLAMVAIISTFVGYQLNRLTDKVQDLSERMAAYMAFQKNNESADQRLQNQIDELWSNQAKLISQFDERKLR